MKTKPAKQCSTAPQIPPTADQMARHAAAIASVVAEGRIAEAIAMLDDAEDVAALGGPSSPLLDLYRAALLPDATAYLPHRSDHAPVPDATLVAVDLGDGRPLVERAGLLCWSAGPGPAGEGRIHRWARVAEHT